MSWFRLPWRATQEAKDQLEMSRDAEARVKKLTDELKEIQRENHITARIHAAFRGEGS